MKHAKANIRGTVRRKAHPIDTKTTPQYRVTATWPDRTGHPLVYGTKDRARAKSVARGHADTGAHVTIEQHANYRWRTIAEYDGPAIIAAREAERRAAEEAAAARAKAELAARAQARRAAVQAARDRAQAAALMVQPPVPRSPQQRTARHTAGQR